VSISIHGTSKHEAEIQIILSGCLSASIQSMGTDPGIRRVPAYPDSGLQQGLWIMVESNWVMHCPGGKSCHIPAVLILSEAEILNTVHVTLPCNVRHKTQVFFWVHHAKFFNGETSNHSLALFLLQFQVK
jgi:hypothetical protein